MMNNNLSTVYLKTQGVDTKGHAIRKEIDRVKKYIKKIDLAEKGPQEEKGPKRRVDSKAAGRMIMAGVKRKF